MLLGAQEKNQAKPTPHEMKKNRVSIRFSWGECQVWVLAALVLLGISAALRPDLVLAQVPAPSAAAVEPGLEAQPMAPPVTAVAPHLRAAQPAAEAAMPASEEGPRGHLLPGLLLGLLLGLAALHLARQVYTEAPGSLAAAGLLAMAFAFEYVSFGLHVPLVGTPHRAAFLEALASAGLSFAALSFLSGYLELAAIGGFVLWGTWAIGALAAFTAVLAIFNADLAREAGHIVLALSAIWAVWLGFVLGRSGDGRASYLVPGLMVIMGAVVAGVLAATGVVPTAVGASLMHGFFVIGLLLVAFAVESVEIPPERAYLALPAPRAGPGAPAMSAATRQPVAGAAGNRETSPPPQAGPDLILAKVSERRLALALAASRHGLWDWNVAQGRITVSPEVESLTGLEPGTFDGSEDAWLERIHEDDRENFKSELARAVRNGEGPFSVSLKLKTPSGELRWALLNGSCLNPGTDGRASRCIGLITPRFDQSGGDPAQRKDDGPAIPSYSRGALIAALDQRLTPSGRPANGSWLLLLIDLDRFHSVNEGFGHETGDRVLEIIAQRLKAGLAENESLFRLGGDEFALLLHDGLGKPPRGVRADRLITLIGRHIPLGDGREVFVSASIGMVGLDSEASSGAQSLKDAEAALYHVKRTGGARYALFAPDMREKARSTAPLESELRRALEREEIELHYQPIMALADGRISGFEALIRWRHAEHGVLSAESFIDIAEKTGLIVPLGKYALAMASVQLYQWQSFYRQSEPLFVCVNISSRHILRYDLVKDVRDVMAAVQLAPNSLRLEVSEQLIADDAESAKTVLKEIKALGAGLALDDFGTGYASFGMLETLPIDTIKVDKSLIARLRESGERPVVMRSIVDLAHDLRMDVIAEGIESENDVRRLRALGCEFGQGFHFGPAMPPDDVHAFISRHRQA